MAVDPVCKMTVEPARAAAQSRYKDETYYFCAVGCKQKFDREPESTWPAARARWAADEVPRAARGPGALRARDGGLGGQHPPGRLHAHGASPGRRRRAGGRGRGAAVADVRDPRG